MNKGYILLPWLLFGFLAIVFLVTLTTGPKGDGEIIVTYDGGEISKQTVYDSMFQLVGAQEIDYLIFDKIVELEADKEKIDITADEMAAELEVIKKQAPTPEEFEMMLMQNGLTEEDLLEQIEKQLMLRKLFAEDLDMTEEELKAQFEEQKELYKEEEQVRASHILVDSEKEAKELLSRIKDGEDFAEVATAHSNDPSKEMGGDLGFFSKGMMMLPFEEAAFALEIGELSDVVESEFGFHIILVTDKVEEKILPYETVKDEVYNDVIDTKISAQLPEWVEQKKEAYHFEVKAN